MATGVLAGAPNRAPRRLLIGLLALSLLSGCGHVPFRTRLARTLVVVGALAFVGGGLVAAGCVHEGATANSVCVGGPGDERPAEGLPVMVLGGALIGAGAALGPEGSRQRLTPPAPSSGPWLEPWLPEPWAPSMPRYPGYP